MAAIEDDIVISCIRTVVVKTCRSAFEFLKFLFCRLLDLIGLVANLVACITIIRCYPLISCLYYHLVKKHEHFQWYWRLLGFYQVLIFIMDIFTFTFLLLEVIFPWRIYYLVKSIDFSKDIDEFDFRNYGFTGFKIRFKVLEQFLRLCTDIVIIPFAIITLLSWRSISTVQILSKEEKDLKRKKIILVEFGLVILDFASFMMFLIQCFTWRLPVMILKVQFYTANDFTRQQQMRLRYSIFLNFLRLLLDILMLPLFVILFFSWRCPILIKKLRLFTTYDRNTINKQVVEVPSRGRREWILRKCIVHHFLRLCIDLAMFVPFFIVLASWRFPVLLIKMKKFFSSKMKRQDELELRKSILFLLSQVFIDVLSVPPAFITCFTWRLLFFVQMFPLSTNKSLGRKFKKVRLQFWKETIYFFLDIPVIIAFILLICFGWICPWRLQQVWKCIRSTESERFASRNPRKPLWCKFEVQNHVRKLILLKCFCMFIDIFVGFVGVLILLSVWKVPFLVYKIKTLKKEGKVSTSGIEIWRAVLKQFALMLLDIVMGILIVVIFCTLWRIPPLVRKIKKHSRYEEAECQDDTSEADSVLPISQDKGLKSSLKPESSTLRTGDTFLDEELDSPCPVNEDLALSAKSKSSANSSDELKQGEDNQNAKESIDNGLKVEIAPSTMDRLYNVRGWKIRKAIVLNIVGLLLDIPATILLLINICSIYQIPFILQRIMECGNFYQEYIYIMVEETLHLLQDIAFFIIFLVLVLVRPFAIWIHILEDREHLRYRKSREFQDQLHHIVKAREKLPALLSSNVTTFIKYFKLHASNDGDAKRKLCSDVLCYTREIKDIRDRLLDLKLDDYLFYLTTSIYFYENKKPYFYYKRYQLEESYCMTPDVKARDFNLQEWTKKMKTLDATLDELYTELESYKPKKVPLWGAGNGFILRSRKQNQHVIIGTITSGYFGTVVLFFLNCILLYRLPVMITRAWKVKYCKYKVREVFWTQSKEYVYDIIYFAKFMFVAIFIYRLPALLNDLSQDILYKKSIAAARKTIDKYPIDILRDLLSLLRIFFRWDTIVFVMSSVLFIVLIPLSVILNIFIDGKVHIVAALFFAVPIYLFFIATPFVVVFKLSDVILSSESAADEYILCLIAGYMVIIVIILVLFVILKTRSQNEEEKVVKSIDYVRYNWFNFQVILLEIIEFIQLMALVFSVRNLGIPYSSEFSLFSQYVLLNVLDYRIKFILSAVIFTVWVSVCTIPSLLEGVTKKVSRGYFSTHHFVWRTYLSFFGVTLFLFLPEASLSVLSCNYTCEGLCPALFGQPSVACWQGSHLIYAAISFFMVMWYTLTSVLYCIKYGDNGNQKVDLHFTPSYAATVNILKLLLVSAVVLFTSYKVYVLSFILGSLALLIVFSTFYHRITGIRPCNSTSLFLWRIFLFTTVFVVCASVLVYDIIIWHDTKLKNTVISVSGLGLVLLLALCTFLLTMKLSRATEHERARQKFKKKALKTLKDFESREEGFIPSWWKISESYRKLLDAVRVANKNDKKFVKIEYDGPNISMDNLPPPPDYRVLWTFPVEPPPDYEEGISLQQGQDDEIGEDHKDPYFLPTMDMYLKPVGAYEQFDAEPMYGSGSTEDPRLFNTGFQMMGENKKLDDAVCTGSSLLLLLEEHIIHTAYNYNFIINLDDWREKVTTSDWIGLLDCLETLLAKLDYSYLKPRSPAPYTATSLLSGLKDDSFIRPYVQAGDISKRKLAIHTREVERLMDLLPEPWLLIFKKLIPQKDSSVPLIYRVSTKKEDESNLWGIKVEMFNELEITVKDVNPDGFKVAIGAKIVLRNPIVISRIRKWNRRINFGKPFPYAKKGMLSHNLTSCSCKQKGDEWSLVAAGKSVNLKKVLASLEHLELVFRNE